MNRRAGFTLLEVMASVAILSIVTGILFVLADSLNRSAVAQEAKISAQDEARVGMELVVTQLRQAAASSLVGPFPGPSLTFRAADDVDGNGSAVDEGGNLELGPARTIRRDTTDAYPDGQTVTQLVLANANGARVLTNGLLPNEDVNNNNALDAGEDVNRNGRLDRGIWFERVNQGIRVTVQTQHRAGLNGPFMNSTLTEIVVPRN
jgi:prepilin-type N-terminal cleavage/methylation domain-containing protein